VSHLDASRPRPVLGRPPPVLVLASRIRVEEKWLLEALDRRKREYRVLDARTAVFGVGSPLPAAAGALMREISH
jgi:[lysine-biosynthesis-protein LysW]---L-2-aminoadipate ligase